MVDAAREGPGPDGLVDEIARAQLAGDSRDAVTVVERALAGGIEVGTIRAAIAASQRTIGELWAQNRISVATEHMATAVAHVALAHLFHRAPLPSRRSTRVVLACVPGEQHAFPARLAADALDLAGFDVLFLGADVPLSGLVTFVEEHHPDALALSVTIPYHLPRVAEVVHAVREVAPAMPILVGGGASKDWTPIVQALGLEGAALDAESLIALLERIAGGAK